jgi:gliding motility-associated-like protein
MKTWTLILGLLLLGGVARAQTVGCSALGQIPETAFPVCGNSVFKQTSVPICTNKAVPVPGCSDPNTSYTDKNPYWYKFTCFQSGSLDFLIKPNDPGDDYDWELFDVTNKSPDAVYTDASLVVAGNWAGTLGSTGASANGVTYTQCASDPKNREPSYARGPKLIAGHHYLLLVSHFTDSQSGYSLSFSGGTAVITDTTAPHLARAVPGCDATTLSVRLNKKMQCKTLAADGSDFVLSPAVAKVAGAASADCDNGFDMDSLTLTLDHALPPGDYKLLVRNGSDQNTLLDNCDNGIPESESVDFSVHPPMPTPIDSVPAIGCAPGTIQVDFGGAMRCATIAADGSDFTITGPVPVMVTGAKGVSCVNGLTQAVSVSLSAPLVHGGVYTLTLKNGTDGNTIYSECDVETPPSVVQFTASDTVSAIMDMNVVYSCNLATVKLSNPGGNGVHSWSWWTDGGVSSPDQAFTYSDTTFDKQIVHLAVSNGVCVDSQTTVFAPDTGYLVRAAFEEPQFVCPNDLVTFVPHTRGEIQGWRWDFGNGNTSYLQSPPAQQYPVVVRSRDFPVTLFVTNTLGCMDTAIQALHVINNCMVLVPTAFTPNGDGVNDYLYPLNAYKAQDLEFRVYNRYGQLMFLTRDWTRKWDGRFHGKPQPMGSYVWMLSYIDSDTHEKVFKKGATLLIR